MTIAQYSMFSTLCSALGIQLFTLNIEFSIFEYWDTKPGIEGMDKFVGGTLQPKMEALGHAPLTVQNYGDDNDHGHPFHMCSLSVPEYNLPNFQSRSAHVALWHCTLTELTSPHFTWLHITSLTCTHLLDFTSRRFTSPTSLDFMLPSTVHFSYVRCNPFRLTPLHSLHLVTSGYVCFNMWPQRCSAYQVFLRTLLGITVNDAVVQHQAPEGKGWVLGNTVICFWEGPTSSDFPPARTHTCTKQTQTSSRL